MSDQVVPVFDGHNDVLLRLYKSKSDDVVSDFLDGEEAGHIDLKKARAGAFVGGLFAMYSPSPGNFASLSKQMTGGSYVVPLPAPLPIEEARKSVAGELAILLRIVRQSQGAVALCKTTAEIHAAIQRGALAVVLHLEGAEAIDGDLHFLEVLYAAGLRSLGPVWSRNNIFGHGVPFAFPGGPDTGDGLTPAGEKLVSACNEMKILVDLSHITEKGFWDVARLSKAPLVATHSNAHALCPSPRNLTDRQLAAIRDSGGESPTPGLFTQSNAYESPLLSATTLSGTSSSSRNGCVNMKCTASLRRALARCSSSAGKVWSKRSL
jgi:membrane dipeptidase